MIIRFEILLWLSACKNSEPSRNGRLPLLTRHLQFANTEVKHDVNGRRQTAKITSDLEFFSSNP